MGDESPAKSQTFRAGGHLYIVIGILSILFVGLGVAIGVSRGNWTFLAVAAAAATVLFLLLQVLRLEVGPAGFKYRNLSGSREVAYADVSRAYFEVVRAEGAPRPAVAFWVDRRVGGRVKVNLRTFPIRAAAALFTALETHGISVEVPDEPEAHRVNDQIKAARAEQPGA